MKIGDRVRVISSGQVGEIGDMADSIAYVDLDNGVELELSVNSLILESDYESPYDRNKRINDENYAAAIFQAEVIISEIPESILNLGKLAQQHAALAIAKIGGSAGVWDTLSAYQKLNFIGVATGIPVALWIQAVADGKIKQLTKTAFMMIADTSKQNS